jgi:hypothetical protein
MEHVGVFDGDAHTLAALVPKRGYVGIDLKRDEVVVAMRHLG